MNSRALRNLRRGRIQRALAAATAFSALPLGAEIYFEHFRGSFGDKWMWTPIALSPLLSVAGIAGVRSERAARRRLQPSRANHCANKSSHAHSAQTSEVRSHHRACAYCRPRSP